MRADVTSLDWANDEVDARRPPVKAPDDNRRTAERVQVRLRVAVSGKRCDYLAESVDISETGVLIDEYRGPRLRPGREIEVQIHGVLSDSDAGRAYCRMRVVRTSGTQVALRFS
jgi:hypothetical protein